ncbi:hypothetical protein [Streptomyces sp. MK5]|uniref:hypothetical protein n=1 Tax=Streptomyces sp. MK5 TaxID=3064253 RepID=UPI002741CF88|nr:hypothetical protein [Streptomyces sp. MK5]
MADMTVNRGEVMADIGNRMEPDRRSARLLGDVRTTTPFDGPCDGPYDDAEVTEVQVQV